MKTTTYTVTSLTVALLSFCTNISPQKIVKINTSENLKTLKIDPQTASLVKLSDIINPSSLEVIPLKFSPGSILGYPDKVSFCDQKIYVGDFSLSKAVFVYDSIGNFLFKAGNVGKGAGEYSELYDFDVTSTGIELLADDNKILKYDNNGHFVDELRTDFYSFKFKKLSDQMYIFYAKNRSNIKFFKSTINYNIIYTDQGGVVKELAFPYNASTNNSIEFPLFDCHFINSNNTIYFSPSIVDTIFKLSGSTIDPAIHYDFGEKSLPQSYFSPTVREEEKSILLKESATVNSGFFFNKDSIYASVYSYKNSNYCSIYNTRTNKSINIKGIIDDINYLTVPIPSCQDRDKLVSVFSSSLLREMPDPFAKEERNTGKIKVRKDLLSNNKNGEFILVKYKLQLKS